MKYIDADKLKAEIKRRHDYENEMYHKKKPDGRPNEGWAESLAIMGVLEELLAFIDSLQQVQPEVALEEAVFKEWGITKEKYLAKSMDKVHLEMEIATYLQDWDDDDEIGLHLSTDNGSIPIELEDIRDLARHFAEWGAEHLRDSTKMIDIEDIEKIHTFLYAVKNNKNGVFTFTRLSDEQYKEVLRRFKAIKEEKK